MTNEPPTQSMPPSDPPPDPPADRPTDPPPDPPARPPLRRSTSDSLIAGVAGGLGRHLNVDPLAIRITFVILSFAGGLGVIAYLGCLLFMPSDDPSAPQARWGIARTLGAGLLAVAAIAAFAPNWVWGPGLTVLLAAGVIVYLLIRVAREEGTSHFTGIAARVAIGIVVFALAIGGVLAAATGAALGGGVAIAGLIIACGVGLVGGAFRGGARWLIVPATVLALPLAAVAATDLDVRGTWGERTFRPATVAELGNGYEMGIGSMRVDLRNLELPPGRTELPLEIGAGEIQVLVPADLCVTTDAEIGMGAFDVGDGEQGGVDLDVVDRRSPAAGVPHLHVVADIGVGALQVGDRFFDRAPFDRWDRSHGFDSVRPGTSLAACEGPA